MAYFLGWGIVLGFLGLVNLILELSRVLFEVFNGFCRGGFSTY